MTTKVMAIPIAEERSRDEEEDESVAVESLPIPRPFSISSSVIVVSVLAVEIVGHPTEPCMQLSTESSQLSSWSAGQHPKTFKEVSLSIQ